MHHKLRWLWSSVWVVAGIAAAVFVVAAVLVISTTTACGCGDLGSQRGELKKLAGEGFRQWAAHHPGERCPTSLAEVAAEIGRTDLKDRWGGELRMVCGDTAPPGIAHDGIGVASPGADRVPFTRDDITSWE